MRYILFSQFGIYLLLAPAVGLAETNPEYHPVVPGLDYAHVVSTNEPWSIHVARLERSHKELDLTTTLGKGTIQGLSSLSQQAKALPARLGKPIAAVNGDFFLIKPGPYQGDPKGLQILDGEIVSGPDTVSFWTTPGEIHIDKIASEMRVSWPDGQKTRIGLNQTPHTNGAVLFTPTFGPSTRATNFTEVILEKADGKDWLPLRANETVRARVRSVNASGDTRLTPDTLVLTLGEKLTNRLASLAAGPVLEVSTALSENLSDARIAIGGGPLLVHRDKEQAWPSAKGTNAYLVPRHPRTAIGFNKRYLFLVEVDGRQKELSVGMKYAELAAFMKSLGCSEAMNLDGGGSSTFWLGGKVMNSPSDKHERSLANALMIVRKSNP